VSFRKEVDPILSLMSIVDVPEINVRMYRNCIKNNFPYFLSAEIESITRQARVIMEVARS
jgi:hypothetical protein